MAREDTSGPRRLLGERGMRRRYTLHNNKERSGRGPVFWHGRHMRISLSPWLVCAGLLIGPCGGSWADAPAELPLVRVDAVPAAPKGPLVLLLTGDGDWVD